MISVLPHASWLLALLLLVCTFLSTITTHVVTEKNTCLDPVTRKVKNLEDLDLQKITISMPGARPSKDDEYLCTSKKLSKETNYIVKFESLSDAVIAHHIILFGCPEPLTVGGIWSCGTICKRNEAKILYAWAKNADPAKLPCNVGFHIGKGSNISSLVMQVHYKNKFTDAQPADNSGLSLYVTKHKQKYAAGIFILDSDDGFIPKSTPLSNIDVSCKFPRRVIYPFAFRTHAHNLGKVVSAYKFNGSWTLIGKSNPHWPQAFYPIERRIKIERNDTVVARCTYNSTGRNSDTKIGPTHEDEMCNFYMMYYSHSEDHIPNFIECINNKFPDFTKYIPASSVEQLPYNPYLEQKALQSKTHPSENAVHQRLNKNSQITREKSDSQQQFQDMTYVPDWPAKNGLTLGHVSGVSVGPDGSVHVFHRGPQIWNTRSFNKSNIFQDQNKPILVPTIVVFSKEGKLLNQWGNNTFFMPHGITVDKNGSVWLTDVALHQVFRFSAGERKLDLELGERFRPGNDKQHFCQPSSVAVMSDGQFFVADGYCNSRIMKFSKEGMFLDEWGHSDSALQSDGFPAPCVFFIVHSVTVAEDKGLVCASDRGNGRIQCFDLSGKFDKQIHLKEFGYVIYSVDYCYQHGGILFAVNGPRNHTKKPCKVFAIDIKTGILLSSWNCPKGLGFPHDISVDNKNHAVYVGDLLAKTVWKLQMTTPNISEYLSKKNEIPQPMVTAENVPLLDNGLESTSDSNFKASVIVGSLLVAPMFFIVLITVFVRYYHAGKLKCCDYRRSMAGHQHRSFFGNLLIDRHKGFNPLNTEDSDHEIDPLNNSDDEDDYRITRKT
ncbi:peptidylglycine alpha-amidating monooxygenase-like [Octopus vulgaris]|uniref:Peptidylglycine alpha-amidating monooxygenase-like n=1 Tax=Octopus vulgaris TaxID=6645 RepID=A0AA36FDL8_OCTVU|nr:peptidylglycine alpha-amidating monooxygenase-like [Octopus vulgaris]